MKFNIEEKELLLSIESNLMNFTKDINSLVEAFNKIRENKLVLGNYLHRLFLDVKEYQNKLELENPAKEHLLILEKKILRRINANK